MRLLFLLLLGCSSVKESERVHSPIVGQILRSRMGVLSNSACSPNSQKNCIPDIVTYDLNDPLVRKLLNDAKFFCMAAGRLFHICPNFAGICRKSEAVVTERFLGIPVKHEFPEEVIPQGPRFDQLSVKCESILKK